MFHQFISILENLIGGKDRFALTPPDAVVSFYDKYNQTEENIPVKPLHVLFKNQCEKTPDHIARRGAASRLFARISIISYHDPIISDDDFHPSREMYNRWVEIIFHGVLDMLVID